MRSRHPLHGYGTTNLAEPHGIATGRKQVYHATAPPATLHVRLVSRHHLRAWVCSIMCVTLLRTLKSSWPFSSHPCGSTWHRKLNYPSLMPSRKFALSSYPYSQLTSFRQKELEVFIEQESVHQISCGQWLPADGSNIDRQRRRYRLRCTS